MYFYSSSFANDWRRRLRHLSNLYRATLATDGRNSLGGAIFLNGHLKSDESYYVITEAFQQCNRSTFSAYSTRYIGWKDWNQTQLWVMSFVTPFFLKLHTNISRKPVWVDWAAEQDYTGNFNERLWPYIWRWMAFSPYTLISHQTCLIFQRARNGWTCQENIKKLYSAIV